jgi:hypothetical protein
VVYHTTNQLVPLLPCSTTLTIPFENACVIRPQGLPTWPPFVSPSRMRTRPNSGKLKAGHTARGSIGQHKTVLGRRSRPAHGAVSGHLRPSRSTARGRAFLFLPHQKTNRLLPFSACACHHRTESESLYSYSYRGVTTLACTPQPPRLSLFFWRYQLLPLLLCNATLTNSVRQRMCHPTPRFTDVAAVRPSRTRMRRKYATPARSGRPHHTARGLTRPCPKPFWGRRSRPAHGASFLTAPENQAYLYCLFLPGACHHRSESLYSYRG